MKYDDEFEKYSLKNIDKTKRKRLEDLEDSRERIYCNYIKNKRTK